MANQQHNSNTNGSIIGNHSNNNNGGSNSDLYQFASQSSTTPLDSESFIIDSASLSHMTGNNNLLSDSTLFAPTMN